MHLFTWRVARAHPPLAAAARPLAQRRHRIAHRLERDRLLERAHEALAVEQPRLLHLRRRRRRRASAAPCRRLHAPPRRARRLDDRRSTRPRRRRRPRHQLERARRPRRPDTGPTPGHSPEAVVAPPPPRPTARAARAELDQRRKGAEQPSGIRCAQAPLAARGRGGGRGASRTGGDTAPCCGRGGGSATSATCARRRRAPSLGRSPLRALARQRQHRRPPRQPADHHQQPQVRLQLRRRARRQHAVGRTYAARRSADAERTPRRAPLHVGGVPVAPQAIACRRPSEPGQLEHTVGAARGGASLQRRLRALAAAARLVGLSREEPRRRLAIRSSSGA